MKNSRAAIDGFLAQPHFALAGYSHNPKKFGHVLYKTLKEKGYTIYPVNPNGGTTPEGETIYKDVTSLPDHVQALLIATRPEVTVSVVSEALNKGVSQLWVQQMSGNQETWDMLHHAGVPAVYNRCILMHANPSGIHKFHRWMAGMFGRIPVN